MSKYDFSQPLARRYSWKWNNESRVDGHDVLPMSVADTDFPSPREVTQAIQAIVDEGEFGYGSYPEDHREVFAAWQQRQHGWAVDPAHVIIANGLLSSLVLMLDEISRSGDGVIVFSPVYQNFFHTIRAADRVPLACDLLHDEDHHWALDLTAFEALCARPEARAVLFCNPHNPVGRAWSVDELQAVVAIAQAHGVIVFSDEIHSDFVYDTRFNPSLKVVDDPRGIMTLTSGGKTFNIGGMFTSYAITEDETLAAALHRGLKKMRWEPHVFGAWGAYSAYRYGYDYRDQVVDYVRQMQRRMVDALNRMPFPVSADLPEATFLLWADFRETGWSADELHRFLVEEAALGFNRGDSYGVNGAGFARINCAVPESRIDEAIQRLTRAFEARPG